ncbi:MAG: hypothetical protein RIA64_07500 [Rhodospirillales bacterium]
MTEKVTNRGELIGLMSTMGPLAHLHPQEAEHVLVCMERAGLAITYCENVIKGDLLNEPRQPFVPTHFA